MSFIDCHFNHDRPSELDQLALDCTANNLTGVDIEACATPYVGVFATGAVYPTHAPVCFDLGPHEGSRQVVASGLPRAACGYNRGEGCAVRTFTLAPDREPVGAVLGFAYEIEDHARSKGVVQPTVRECNDLIDIWRRGADYPNVRGALTSPSDAVMWCRLLPRVDFECLRAARDDHAVDACAPHR